MLGKLAGAWLGKKVAGPNEGAKGADGIKEKDVTLGAVLGFGAAALARRSVPALAAVALGGWAFKRWRERRRSNAGYPSDSSPVS